MKSLRRVWEEIRRGESLDLYITILVATILVILNLINLIPESALSPFNLGVLALLSFSILQNRYRLDTLLEQSSARNQIMLAHFPDSLLLHDLEKAKQLILIGVDLSLVLKQNFPLLERKLRKGHVIKVALVNPDGPACEMAAVLHYEPTSYEEKRTVIRRSIRMLNELKEKTHGKLEIRLLNHLPTFGAIVADLHTADGAIYLWHYAFKAGDTERLKLIVRHADGTWFEKFKIEIDTILNNTKPLPLPPTRARRNAVT